jgi:hypothetical protein
MKSSKTKKEEKRKEAKSKKKKPKKRWATEIWAEKNDRLKMTSTFSTTHTSVPSWCCFCSTFALLGVKVLFSLSLNSTHLFAI